jgi:hypothetical protein
MPTFFFHIYDDAAVRDDEGIELADTRAAEAAMLQGVRALICEQVRKGRISLHHRIDVEDESGAPVASLRFGDAVTIER